jgi:GNAT superfamily N-acetyltransferase
MHAPVPWRTAGRSFFLHGVSLMSCAREPHVPCNPIRIRPATSGGTEALDLFEEAVDTVFRQHEHDTSSVSSRAAGGATQSDYSVILEWSDRPLAAAGWSCHTDNKDSHSASLDRFVVDGRFQAAGFGRRLLAAVEEDMRAVGCSHLHMTAPPERPPGPDPAGVPPYPLDEPDPAHRRNHRRRYAHQTARDEPRRPSLHLLTALTSRQDDLYAQHRRVPQSSSTSAAIGDEISQPPSPCRGAANVRP